MYSVHQCSREPNGQCYVGNGAGGTIVYVYLWYKCVCVCVGAGEYMCGCMAMHVLMQEYCQECDVCVVLYVYGADNGCVWC